VGPNLTIEVGGPLKAYLFPGLYMLVLLASPRMALVSGRIFAGIIQNLMLFETSEYSPGHQRHLGEANKTNM